MAFKETPLTGHSCREIASRIGDALCDLTGQILETEVLALDSLPGARWEVRLRVRLVPDSEIEVDEDDG